MSERDERERSIEREREREREREINREREREINREINRERERDRWILASRSTRTSTEFGSKIFPRPSMSSTPALPKMRCRKGTEPITEKKRHEY